METVPQLIYIDIKNFNRIIWNIKVSTDLKYISYEEAGKRKAANCRGDRRYPDLTHLEIRNWSENIFVQFYDASRPSDSYVPISTYEVKIKIGAFYDIVVELRAFGLSFRQTARLAY